MSKYSKAKQTGNKGVSIVESALSDYAIVHVIDESKDLGLDMICEWVYDEKPTHLLFGVQVKTRSNFKPKLTRERSKLNKLKEYNGKFYIKPSTIEYLKGFSFPIFLFVVTNEVNYKIYYKRYTSILHGLVDDSKEPFYLVKTANTDFKAYVKNSHTVGFCRDLFFDHLRCEHSKGMLSGINPKDLGLKGWKWDTLYIGVYDQYQDKILATYENYRRYEKYIKGK